MPPLTGRDHAIDRLRGLCLVSMTVGHLAQSGRVRSPLDEVVHSPTWISGAAGFVFLSGVSVGLVWTRRGGASAASRRWTASRGLFLGALALTLNLVGIAWFALVGRPEWYPTIGPTATAVLTGRWAVPFTLVLSMYAVFLVAAAAFATWLVNRTSWAVTVAGALYLSSLALPGFGPTQSPGMRPTWDLLAWQIVFVTGMACGLHWVRVRAWLEANGRLVGAAGLTGVGLIVGLRLGFNLAERGFDPLGLGANRYTIESWWLNKNALGPARLALIALVGPGAYLLCRRPLPADHLLTSAGSRSLRVYSVSTLAVLIQPLAGLPHLPLVVGEVEIALLTLIVVATGLTASVGRGRWWSF